MQIVGIAGLGLRLAEPQPPVIQRIGGRNRHHHPLKRHRPAAGHRQDQSGRMRGRARIVLLHRPGRGRLRRGGPGEQQECPADHALSLRTTAGSMRSALRAAASAEAVTKTTTAAAIAAP